MKKTITMKTQAVIFDMDGVITHTMPDHYRAWKQVLGKMGVEVSHLDVYSREGQKGITSITELLAEKKIPAGPARVQKILDDKEALFKKIVRVRFVPGTRTLLRDLQRDGFRLALVTGTARHELQRILPTRLYNRFEVVVTGSDVHNGKPHPEPFQRALRKLSLSPQDAVVLENAPFGIRSAQEAGLRCLALETSLPRRYLSQADHVFSCVKTLRQRVRWILPQRNRS